MTRFSATMVMIGAAFRTYAESLAAQGRGVNERGKTGDISLMISVKILEGHDGRGRLRAVVSLE
jgi:hypothetical protein